MSNRVTRYLFRVAISIDQLGNTLLGGRPDETISGNVGGVSRNRRNFRLA